MPLSGTFDTVGLPELLQWFSQTKKSGSLTISVGMEDTYLILEGGDVAAIGSDDPLRLDLGQVLLATRRIDEDQLNQAARLATQGGSVPQALVDAGLLSEAEMRKLQFEHLFETVMDLFFEKHGSFHFQPLDSDHGLLAEPDIPAANRLVQALPTSRILMESMRRVDEWNRIRQIFPNRFVVVQAKGKADDNPIWRELTAMGRPVSVGELCLRMGGNRFQVFSQLYEAYNLGLLGLDLMPTGKAGQAHLGPSQMLMENARLLVAEKQFDEAREVLATLANLEPDNPEVRRLIKQVREGQLEQLYQLIPPHKRPVLTRSRQDLAQSDLGQREQYLASRLSGTLDVATLVVATPLGELQTLRILRNLIHAGIAKLES